MRDEYHEELDGIKDTLVEMAGLVSEAIRDATTALLDANLEVAEAVIASDDVIDDLQHGLDDRTIDLMARQQPVAGDLRTLVASLRMSADLERMGDLANHVAKVARMRYPAVAVPKDMTEIIQRMAVIAESLAKKVAVIIQERDTQKALELGVDDDEMDILHRRLFVALLDSGWPYGNEVAIDMTLIGRYYERFADHAVSVARRLYFLVTGEYADI
ncbi:MAG TPA: phosphate signaling complex protein PhoU [Candidatus Nanopelagicaceae bacterium]|nr:phosphate signaling complex protein PhoU [Candidatus Nanopelagicaceae bacterium]